MDSALDFKGAQLPSILLDDRLHVNLRGLVIIFNGSAMGQQRVSNGSATDQHLQL